MVCTLLSEALGNLLCERIRVMCDQAALVRAQDPDGIHDMRVASRRLRAALREAKPAFGKTERKHLNQQVKKITRALGTARELDVSIALLHRLRPRFRRACRRAATHALADMEARRRAATPDVLYAGETVESEGFHRAVAALMESRRPGRSCYLDGAVSAILEHYATLQKAHARWHESQVEEDLHQTRIAFKKLRYVCESYRNAYGEPMDEFIKGLKNAQEALGQWNDCRVLRDYVLAGQSGADDTARAGIPELTASLEKRMTRLLRQFDRTAGAYLASGRHDGPVSVLARPLQRCPDCSHQPPVL